MFSLIILAIYENSCDFLEYNFFWLVKMLCQRNGFIDQVIYMHIIQTTYMNEVRNGKAAEGVPL